MIWLCFVVLAFQGGFSYCSDYVYEYENEKVQDEVLSDIEVQELDASVKKRLIDHISSKWNSTYTQLEKNQQKYEIVCISQIDTLKKECEKCAKKVGCILKNLLKKLDEKTMRVLKNAHKAVKKTAKKIVGGAKKVTGEIIKGVRKVTRKVARIVTKVARGVARVARRIARVIPRAVRFRVPRVRVRFRFRRFGKRDAIEQSGVKFRFRRWGKRDAIVQSGEECAKKCSSCQRLKRAEDTDNYDDICGINNEGNSLIKLLEELDASYPNEDISIVTKVSREMKKGKERTVVQMNLKNRSQDIWFPNTFFDNRFKLERVCFNVYKKNAGKILM